MIYELSKGFSGGFTSDLTRDEINEHYAEIGVSIVYADGPRRIFIDDKVNPEEAQYYIANYGSKPTEPDWKTLYRNDVVGYGALHPYFEK